MSTSSIKSDKYKYDHGYDSKESIATSQSSLQQFKSRQSRREFPHKIQLNDKSADELSSFIAEFSYITDIPIKISNKENPRALHSFQIFPINSIKNDTHIFSLHDSAPYKNQKSEAGLEDNKKTVEWKDLKRNSPLYKKKYHNTSGTDLTYIPITSNTEEENTSDKKKYNKVTKNRTNKHQKAFRSQDRDDHKMHKSRSHSIKQMPLKARNHSQIFKSRNREGYKMYRSRSRSIKQMPLKARDQSQIFKSRNRDGHKMHRSRSRSVKQMPLKARSQSQKFKSRHRNDYKRHSSRSHPRQHIFKISSSQHRKRPRESRSKHRKPRRRLRSQSSKSLVKYLPLRYERKRSKGRRVHKKIKKSIPIKKKQVKKLEVSESPTLITLYPSNFQCIHRPICEYDLQFMADQALPCKCFECMRKYKIMKQISPWTACRRGVNCTGCSMKYICQQKEEEWARTTRSEYWDTDAVPCKNLYMDECFRTPKWSQSDYYEEVESETSKSFYFKVNSFNHHIDSTIKKYFISILNNSTYS